MRKPAVVSALVVTCLMLAGCGSVFVPKKYGIGWTLNWANPVSYVVLAAIIAAAILLIVARNKK